MGLFVFLQEILVYSTAMYCRACCSIWNIWIFLQNCAKCFLVEQGCRWVLKKGGPFGPVKGNLVVWIKFKWSKLNAISAIAFVVDSFALNINNEASRSGVQNGSRALAIPSPELAKCLPYWARVEYWVLILIPEFKTGEILTSHILVG